MEVFVCNKHVAIVHPADPFHRGNSALANAGLLGRTKDAFIFDLCAYLSPNTLCSLMQCCKHVFVIAASEDVWKHKVSVRVGDSAVEYRGCWRDTYVRLHSPASSASGSGIRLGDIYSDLCFRNQLYRTLPLDPRWLSLDNIPRRSKNALSIGDFRRDYEIPNMPVILEDVVSEWPAMFKWNTEYLCSALGEFKLNAGGFKWTMREYFQYCSTQHDEIPLYLFDKSCFDHTNIHNDFSIPQYFDDDMLRYLGEDRPDYRWIIIGPVRSGSSFHKDPNCTSAFNAIVRGKKRWILFPPHIPPPGVHPSLDGSDVVAPLGLVEWFNNFFEDAQQIAHYEATVSAGELLFVPRGWWHMVLNLEESIAITQNFVPQSALARALHFFDTKRHLISGLPHNKRTYLHGNLVAALERYIPAILVEAQKNSRTFYKRSQLVQALGTRAHAPNAIVPAKRPRCDSDEYSTTMMGAHEQGNSSVMSCAPTSFAFAFSFSKPS